MAKVSAFGGARQAAAPKSKGPSGPIFVVEDFKDKNNELIYTKKDLATAVEDYAKGKDQVDRGEALMSKSRKPILDFARAKFADFWAKLGQRPQKSPKVLSDEKGDGAMASIEFQDRECNLTEDEYDALADVIGDDNAKSVTTRGWTYSFNTAMLDIAVSELPQVQDANDEGVPLYTNDKQTMAISEGTKIPRGFKPLMRSQTYYDMIEQALVEKFINVYGEEKAGDRLDGLLVKKQVFKTNKGMINRLLEFVGPGTDDTAERLALAIERAKVRTNIKPGALKKDGPGEPGASDSEEDDD